MSRVSAKLKKDKKLWERKFVVSNYDDDAFQKLKYRHVIINVISNCNQIREYYWANSQSSHMEKGRLN